MRFMFLHKIIIPRYNGLYCINTDTVNTVDNASPRSQKRMQDRFWRSQGSIEGLNTVLLSYY